MNESSFSFEELSEGNFIFILNNYPTFKHLSVHFFFFSTFLKDVMISIFACKHLYCFLIVSSGEIFREWVMNLYEGVCYQGLVLCNSGSWLSRACKAVVCMCEAGA